MGRLKAILASEGLTKEANTRALGKEVKKAVEAGIDKAQGLCVEKMQKAVKGGDHEAFEEVNRVYGQLTDVREFLGRTIAS